MQSVGILQSICTSLGEKRVGGNGGKAIGSEQPVLSGFLRFNIRVLTDVQRMDSKLDEFRADHEKAVTLERVFPAHIIATDRPSNSFKRRSSPLWKA